GAPAQTCVWATSRPYASAANTSTASPATNWTCRTSCGRGFWGGSISGPRFKIQDFPILPSGGTGWPLSPEGYGPHGSADSCLSNVHQDGTRGCMDEPILKNETWSGKLSSASSQHPPHPRPQVAVGENPSTHQ